MLCVMLGNNDAWSRLEPTVAAEVGSDGDAELGGAFVLRWRTGRLLALLLRGRAFGAANEPAALASGGAGGFELLDVAAGFALLERLP